MPLCNMKTLMAQAAAQNRAVGSFSVSSIDMVLGVLDAAVELKTPVILQVAQVRLPYSPLKIFGPAMLAAARECSLPIAVHLDHGTSVDCVKTALDLGFTSVMIDGSARKLEENIRLTQSVIEMAKPYGAAVEAEIGVLGRGEAGEETVAVCADPADARRFSEETHVDALAVAIGNAHGLYKGKPELHFDVLQQIHECCDTPLVLHGGTGIYDDDFRRCISLGMRKINIATATFMAATEAAQGASGYFDMAGKIRRAAAEVAKHHIQVFGVNQ